MSYEKMHAAHTFPYVLSFYCFYNYMMVNEDLKIFVIKVGYHTPVTSQLTIQAYTHCMPNKNGASNIFISILINTCKSLTNKS